MNTRIIIGIIIGGAVPTMISLAVNSKLTDSIRDKDKEIRMLKRDVFNTELKLAEKDQEIKSLKPRHESLTHDYTKIASELQKCRAYTLDMEEVIGKLTEKK